MSTSNLSPLKNVCVVDMTEALAGPYCSMMLGDLGADVIKVERPGIGDQSRRWGPPFVSGESAYFLSTNRNKRSLELDIKDPEDGILLRRLIARADVFLTNIPRMESLRRAGIDPESLHGIQPGLIYALISGYGHTGPKANRPGYDIIAQGEAGLMGLTGEPGGEPIRFPTPMADITAGLYTLIGILSALYARDRQPRGSGQDGPGQGGSGKGQVIDVALLDGQVTWLANLAGSLLATGEPPKRLGNVHPSITPYQPVRAQDKAFLIAVGTERLWKNFCGVLGAEEASIEEALLVDPRFATNEERNTHRAELIAALEEILGRHPAAHWIEACVAAGVPAGPIHLPEETLQDEQLIARGMVVEMEHPLAGLVRSIGNPIHFSSTAPTYRRHPPLLGEHNAEIRAELAES